MCCWGIRSGDLGQHDAGGLRWNRSPFEICCISGGDEGDSVADGQLRNDGVFEVIDRKLARSPEVGLRGRNHGKMIEEPVDRLPRPFPIGVSTNKVVLS
jgi:hypothetical protein